MFTVVSPKTWEVVQLVDEDGCGIQVQRVDISSYYGYTVQFVNDGIVAEDKVMYLLTDDMIKLADAIKGAENASNSY